MQRKKIAQSYEKMRVWRTMHELNKRLDFSCLDESNATREDMKQSLGILLPHEMDLGSFQHTSCENFSKVSDGILTETQMAYDSFEDSTSKINPDYLLKRLEEQIILHNTLLDASEKFPKSPSIENLVKQCMKGTQALDDLKQRVARYKLAKQSEKANVTKTLHQDISQIIHETVSCAEELQTISQYIMQISSCNTELMNRSSLTDQTIKISLDRLQEIERMWQNMPLSNDEDTSFGILHESDMHESVSFLHNVSTSLENIFSRINQSVDEVLKTPNTSSLSALKTNLQECKKLLSDIELNRTLLFEETFPSLVNAEVESESPLLSVIADVLDKSWKSEIEAFLEIWKSPEKERFLQVSKQTIDDLSLLRQETNNMLAKGEPVIKANQRLHRQQDTLKRLDKLRANVTGQKPVYTSIILKDYLDENDLLAEQNAIQESLFKVESTKRLVKFADQSDQSASGKAALSKTNQSVMIEKRLEHLMQEMDNFQRNFSISNKPQANIQNDDERKSRDLIEEKLEGLMVTILELVKTLRTH
ncbi:uncharacterized protein LOC128722633 [Anopheles nili]|uniref:uncharacterized protein LOC128722633 n=1 Tax=Anopheles nili TaxID=185578 RepID=UPI00237B5BAF|nr:uncharacterized protein LOC128722633 [Anopheles nili]